MAVNVRIVFSGLCMLVPDDREKVHVLMPHARPNAAGSGRPIHPHFFGLAYDANAKRPPGGKPSADPTWEVIKLDGHLVHVANGTQRRCDRYIPADEVVVVDKLVNFPGVDPKYRNLTEHGNRSLNGRVFLHAGRRDVPIVEASKSCLKPLEGSSSGSEVRCQSMTEHAPWTIEQFPSVQRPGGQVLDLARLLTVQGLWQRPPRLTLPPLYADENNEVWLIFIHAPQNAFPDRGRFPVGESDGLHFAAYYDLAPTHVPTASRYVTAVKKQSPERLPKKFGKPAQATIVPPGPGRSPSAFCSDSQATFA
jgi:hypothetical protein